MDRTNYQKGKHSFDVEYNSACDAVKEFESCAGEHFLLCRETLDLSFNMRDPQSENFKMLGSDASYALLCPSVVGVGLVPLFAIFVVAVARLLYRRHFPRAGSLQQPEEIQMGNLPNHNTPQPNTTQAQSDEAVQIQSDAAMAARMQLEEDTRM